jgi:hypothetical protein
MTNVGGKGFNAVLQVGDGNSNSPVDLKQQYGPSDYDRTNRFIFNCLWELPHPSNGLLGAKALGDGSSGAREIRGHNSAPASSRARFPPAVESKIA